MKSSSNLKSLLKNIDRKGYPAYKSTQGTYDFWNFIFFPLIMYRAYPFASPSKIKYPCEKQERLDFLLLFMIQNINRLHSVII